MTEEQREIQQLQTEVDNLQRRVNDLEETVFELLQSFGEHVFNDKIHIRCE